MDMVAGCCPANLLGPGDPGRLARYLCLAVPASVRFAPVVQKRTIGNWAPPIPIEADAGWKLRPGSVLSRQHYLLRRTAPRKNCFHTTCTPLGRACQEIQQRRLRPISRRQPSGS